MFLSTMSIVKISWSIFLIIPIISFLLPSTGVALLQVGVLLAVQAVLLFLVADPMMGAIIWMIYVGAVSVLFLVAVTSLTPMQWKTQPKGWYKNSSFILTVIALSTWVYNCFVETMWVVTRANANTLGYSGFTGNFTTTPNSYAKADPFIFQAIGFADAATTYILCGILLLIGMYVVIQTLVTPETVTKYIEKNSQNKHKWY